MIGIINYVAFGITALLFIITPGIDTIFILNKSITQGSKSGIKATLGISSGVLIHTFTGAIGLSVILAQSALAFSIIKYTGTLYLIYLGFIKIKKKKEIVFNNEIKKNGIWMKSDFWAGFLTNALNPKVALFFLAFFPQFISPNHIENATPFIILGFTYAFIGLLWFVLLTYFASTFLQKIKGNPNSSRILNTFNGLVFILMGIKIALTKN